MKYYIPTSSLNLDNILQSECIMPISHYVQRHSGYRTYEQIEELRGIESIVLFKYPVIFEIKDTERYNFPLLIEFEDDVQTQDLCDIEKQDDVCICNHAINLTPKNCRFFFFSESAYRITTINTKDNKSIKYYKDYKITCDISYLKFKPLRKITEVPCSNPKVSEEATIDKQKGALYAYLLGEHKSLNHDLAVQLRLSQELYNILTSLIKDQSNRGLKNKLSILLEEYKNIDIKERRNKEIFDTELQESMLKHELTNKEGLIDFLKENNLFDGLCKKYDVSFLSVSSDPGNLRSEIVSRTNSAISEFRKSKKPSTINAVAIDRDEVVLPNAPLVNEVLKYIITNQYSTERIHANQQQAYMDIVKNIVVPIIKEKVGKDKWDDSLERKYLGDLYQHINYSFYSFTINAIDNIELRSIAAILLKGYSFAELQTLCRTFEFEDYRYVLAMWGCLQGYMEISRDVLADILNMNTYSEVYMKIFGKRIETSSDSEEETDENQSNLAVFSKVLNILDIKEDYKTPLLEKYSPSITGEDWENIVNQIIPKRATKQRKLAQAAYAICQSKEEKRNSIINDHALKLNDKQKEQIRDQFSSLFPGMNATVPNNSNPIVKNNETSNSCKRQSILNDLSWIEECADLITNTSARKRFEEDMRYIVNNYKPEYIDDKKCRQPGRYANDDHSNSAVLKKIIKHIEDRITPQNPKLEWARKFYCNVPLDRIKNCILSKYEV